MGLSSIPLFALCALSVAFVVHASDDIHIGSGGKPPAWSWDYDTTFRYIWYADAASINQTVGLAANWNKAWNASGIDCSYCTTYAPAASFVPTLAYYDTAMQSFGFIGYNPVFEEIVIVFRGSTTTKNWITDLASERKVAYPYSALLHGSRWNKKLKIKPRVGAGFLKYYESQRGPLMAQLKTLLAAYPKYKIAVVGHSLGGAAASLCATELAILYGPTLLDRSNRRVVTCTTFGEPRTGNPDYVTLQLNVLGAVTRVVNNHDIVPHLPPPRILPPKLQWKFTPFAHETNEVWERPANGTVNPLTTNYYQNYTVCSATNGEDPNCSDSVHRNFSLVQHNQYMGINCCRGPQAPANGTPKNCTAATNSRGPPPVDDEQFVIDQLMTILRAGPLLDEDDGSADAERDEL